MKATVLEWLIVKAPMKQVKKVSENRQGKIWLRAEAIHEIYYGGDQQRFAWIVDQRMIPSSMVFELLYQWMQSPRNLTQKQILWHLMYLSPVLTVDCTPILEAASFWANSKILNYLYQQIGGSVAQCLPHIILTGSIKTCLWVERLLESQPNLLAGTSRLTILCWAGCNANNGIFHWALHLLLRIGISDLELQQAHQYCLTHSAYLTTEDYQTFQEFILRYRPGDHSRSVELPPPIPVSD